MKGESEVPVERHLSFGNLSIYDATAEVVGFQAVLWWRGLNEESPQVARTMFGEQPNVLPNVRRSSEADKERGRIGGICQNFI